MATSSCELDRGSPPSLISIKALISCVWQKGQLLIYGKDKFAADTGFGLVALISGDPSITIRIDAKGIYGLDFAVNSPLVAAACPGVNNSGCNIHVYDSTT